MYTVHIPAFTITVTRREPEIPPTIPPDIPPELDAESIISRTAKLRVLVPERTIRRVIEDCREDPDFAAFGAVDWDLVYELFGLARASDGIPDDEISDDTPPGRKGGNNGSEH